MIDDNQIKEALEVITNWFSKHANPDSPVIVSGSESWSPRQIKLEAESRCKNGYWPNDVITSIVESSAKRKIKI